MKKKLNAAGEKEMRHHIKDVTAARKGLMKQAGKIKSNLKTKIGHAMSQDKKAFSDMKKSDKKDKIKSPTKTKRINAAGEKELKTHMRYERKIRGSLKKQTERLKKDIPKKINGAIAQDKRMVKDMKRADRRKKK